VIASRLRRQALLFVIALGLLALAYAIAFATNATGFELPNAPVSGAILVGVIAVALSLPPVGLAAFLLIRPNLRRAWSNTSRKDRIGVVAYLAVSVAEAVAAWVALFFVMAHH
jgi:hypothetical protein